MEGKKKMKMNMIMSVSNIYGGWGILVAVPVVVLLIILLLFLWQRKRLFFASPPSSTPLLASDSINSNLRSTPHPSFCSIICDFDYAVAAS